MPTWVICFYIYKSWVGVIIKEKKKVGLELYHVYLEPKPYILWKREWLNFDNDYVTWWGICALIDQNVMLRQLKQVGSYMQCQWHDSIQYPLTIIALVS